SARFTAQPGLPLLGNAVGHSGRLRHRRRVRHPACSDHRACADAGKESAALGHLLADGADSGDRPHRHRGARRHRHPRAVAEIDHLRLSVLFSGHHRHGQGIELARSDSTRSDANLVGEQTASVLEAALAVVDPVSVHQPQSFGDDFAGRRHRRRTADRRPGRHRRAAPDRLILWTDGADLGGAVRRRDHGRQPGCPDRSPRPMDGAPDGGTDVILRSQIGGFWLAALGLLAALALPLSSETVAPLTARPDLLAAVIAAACLFALAPRWPVLSAAFGGLGVILGCFVTLILLGDSGIAGYATWGFWLLTLATWLGAILALARLAALRTADQS